MSNKEDFRDMEMARVNGQLEATKHYYAVLLAKNVSKVEDALKWAEEAIEDAGEFDKVQGDYLGGLQAKIRRTKDKKKAKQMEVLWEEGWKYLNQVQMCRDTFLRIRHQLKQVL